MNVDIYPLNDQSIVISFGNEIDEETSQKVQRLYHVFRNVDEPYLVDLVPAYTTLTIFFDNELINYEVLKDKIKDSLHQSSMQNAATQSKKVYIPVLYKGADLEIVANHNKLSIDEVIELHEQNVYMVYMIGFLPGFPYLGGLNERLATPRLNEPRSNVEAGSVGIAGQQTGIYPVNSPGGWNIIGYTPVKLFDMDRESPFLFQAGDSIKFYSINQATYDEMIQTSYNPQVEWFDEN
ncbi:5-oxoprolinase subunit PxpB [Filobacillus milosensis]|uniref:5-oxoprolinase subunit PxpB n=1 Tax=Filobacillus milosensis TaxID=94137 RepID=A0A4Y8IEU8_9BACI|nr:5-oxoprolinase subunit PxpB [Filobacillus milosensis]TFB15074.1 5-oxoprolinase subunit PxpB [Filobacillus milosensis]